MIQDGGQLHSSVQRRWGGMAIGGCAVLMGSHLECCRQVLERPIDLTPLIGGW